MTETGISLYEANQQIMLGRPELTKEELSSKIEEIEGWFKNCHENYFVLLCREKADYTIFNFVSLEKDIKQAGVDLLEVVSSRGKIVDIYLECGNYAIWVKANGLASLYYLSPCNDWVVEI